MDTEVHFSSASAEWYTPPDLFADWNGRFGPFDLDPCASPSSPIWPLVARRYTAQDDGLSLPWDGRTYCNPPYGRAIGAWTRKAAQEFEAKRAKSICMLVPARTDTGWWHEALASGAEPTFLRGRIRFWGADEPYKSNAPFPSALLIWRS